MTEQHDDLQPIVIDLDAAKSGKLDEWGFQQMGAGIKELLKLMFGGSGMPVSVRGSRSDVTSFAKTSTLLRF